MCLVALLSVDVVGGQFNWGRKSSGNTHLRGKKDDLSEVAKEIKISSTNMVTAESHFLPDDLPFDLLKYASHAKDQRLDVFSGTHTLHKLQGI